jgi:threonine dehydrogenase-like Zn-dependent dehydrogenase
MAPYLLAEEKDLVGLPDELTFIDGALVACGFGTAFEALMKIGISGEHSTLVTGLGPVGLATAILARKLGSSLVIGVEAVKERKDLALHLGACDEVLGFDEGTLGSVRATTHGRGVDRAVDCTGDGQARVLAVRATASWGKIALVGEGGDLSLNPSPDLIHEQKTVCGSWVTSLWRMTDLVALLAHWQSHPEETVTHAFGLEEASAAYEVMASGKSGKVAVLFDEELIRFSNGDSHGK